MMKNIKLNITILLLVSFISLQSQNRRPLVDKMHEHKWNVMMSQVKLTNDEMALVKPIFLEYEQAIWKIHQERIDKYINFKKRRFSGSIDYNSLNNRYINSEIKQAQLLREYHIKLKKILDLFYEYYNERRLHSSIANLSPSIFWSCWNNGWVERTVDLKKIRNKFKLLIPYYEIKTRLLEQEKLEKNENFLECISN